MTDCADCSYTDTVAEIRKEFPNFKLVWKQDSRFMRLIAFFLRCITFGLQSTFQTHYITTIGCTVYVPDSWRTCSDLARTITLRHERVHMRQRRALSMPLFTFL